MMKMNVALCQFTPGTGKSSVEDNISRVADLIEEVVHAHVKPDLVMLPEMWQAALALGKNAPSASEQGAELEETLDGRCVSFLRKLAQKHHIWIAGGSLFLKKDDGKRYNSQIIIDRDGNIAGIYDKTHLCEWVGEHNGVAYGKGISPVKTEFGILAPILCYDIRFEELIRGYSFAGAQILLVPACFSTNLNHWRLLVQTRALENQMFVLGCGCCGDYPLEYKGQTYPINESGQQIYTDKFIHYMGHSMIVDPEGKILAEAGDDACVIRATLDLDRVTQVRQSVSYIESVRPTVYKHYHNN